MEFISGIREKEVLGIQEVISGDYEGRTVRMNGTVHTIRHMGEVAFVILRKAEGLVQCVCEGASGHVDLKELKEECAAEVKGTVRKEERAPHGFEIRVEDIKILSRPADTMPIPVNKWKLNTSLETKLAFRPISLRNIRERAKFKIQEGIVRGFRDYLFSQGFTEIHTPKIVARGAEGGSNVFKLDYFNKKAELGQSPQFYKQTMVGVYDRVFETAPVFRAEKHNTTRHLNEYTGLDFEMGYIDGMEDVMQMETAMLQHTMAYVKEHCAPEIALLDVDVPRIGAIPCIRFADALALLKTLGGGKNRNDLTPEDEVLLCEYYREKGLGEFVFVTHFPTAKRPFYVMDDPHNPRETLSFDLLFRGLEVTTGGQRIHDYDAQVAKMQARGLDPAQFESYIGVHRCGLPPHGGLGIGLERLTMKLCGLSNIRDASLFPRDINHLVP